jgi:hypothetical protein
LCQPNAESDSFPNSVDFGKSIPFSTSVATHALPILSLTSCDPSTLSSYTCQGFLLRSFTIRCPNHLGFLLLTISVTGRRCNIPLIFLFIIMMKFFLPTNLSRLILEPTQPPVQCIPDISPLPRKVKRPEHEANYS